MVELDYEVGETSIGMFHLIFMKAVSRLLFWDVKIKIRILDWSQTWETLFTDIVE